MCSDENNAEMELQRFFGGLTPRLETARMLEHELDRQLARPFNALDYLRTDELGLSRIVADLLNPQGKHCQGAMFLKLLLDSLGFDVQDRLDAARVVVEKAIKGDRRLDVWVDINGQYCLAIENKPYAGDQPNQVKDYLDWLKSKYQQKFMLIYLSPKGEPPSPGSVEPAFLSELGRTLERDDFFRIMPYHKTQDSDDEKDVWEDEFDRCRLGFSLADWLANGRRNCDVERLRWFLREAETFATRAIGGHAVGDNEASALKEFLFSDEKNWESAIRIERSLPGIKRDVIGGFLTRIWQGRQRSIYPDDMDCRYVAWGKRGNWLCMFSKSWESASDFDSGQIHDQNTQLRLESTPLSNWYIGICSRTLPGEAVTELKAKLPPGEKGHGGRYWIWWQWIDKRYRNWDDLIPLLRRECNGEGGEEGRKVLEYFVEKFAEIAKVAIPVIDKCERPDD